MSSLKTDFEKIYEIFVNFFKTEPKWAIIAEADLAFAAAPAINSIVLLTSGAAADVEVSNVLDVIQKDLILATRFIQAEDYSKNLTDVLNTIVANLTSLLALAAIKSSAKVNEITIYVKYIVVEIEAVAQAIPTSK